MATEQELALVREYIGEPNDANGWTDARISVFIAGAANLPLAAADIWGVKAGANAGLVNVSESGSSRSLGDLLKQAAAMEAYYRKRGNEIATPTPVDSGPVIRTITRQR